MIWFEAEQALSVQPNRVHWQVQQTGTNIIDIGLATAH
jgi:hypothetical protein